MSNFFDELMTSLNEAVAIEQGKLQGRKSVYESQPVKKYSNEQIKQISTAIDIENLVVRI